MRTQDLRALAWLCSLVVFFILWIATLHLAVTGIEELKMYLKTDIPRWLESTVYFSTLPLVLLPVSMLIGRWMDRIAPVRNPESASWDQQGNDSAAH